MPYKKRCLFNSILDQLNFTDAVLIWYNNNLSYNNNNDSYL